MCGISGIINKSNQKVDMHKLHKMNDLIAHRGPDDEGFFIQDNFAFGHRRLSILDLSSDGHQPMSYLDGKYTLTYNGEIYNYLEIKEELIGEGYSFDSETDTEVILAAYDKWGEECVSHFNGMWSFALYDKAKEVIFCSRDRFGIKPFYYSDTNGKFIFGSEIKQLLVFQEKAFVEEGILLDYMIYGLVEHSEFTFFKDIVKLEQSNNLIYDLKSHTYKIKQFYDIKLEDRITNLDSEKSKVIYQEVFENSIKLRLRSDIKVGTCLSGGLDSSSIAAKASKICNTKGGFCAIHAKSTELSSDESSFALTVSKYCNLNLQIIEPTVDEFIKNIKEVVYTQEEPFISPSIFMQYFVMRKAKEIGCHVMLDGQGGDETLFGYENYFRVYFASLIRNFKWLRFFKELNILQSFKFSKYVIFRNAIATLMRHKLQFIEKYIRKQPFAFKVKVEYSYVGNLFFFSNFKMFQKTEILKKNLPGLLRYEDKNSMRNSIETRLPFIDYRCVETAVSIHDDMKFKEGYLKYLLRKIMEPILPVEIVWRKNKYGFESPTRTWLNEHKECMTAAIYKSKIINTLCDIEKINISDNDIFWRLFNIAIWEEEYKVSLKVKNENINNFS